MTTLETFGNVLRFAGLLVTIVGLWFTAGGMRVVVSGRIDERRRSAMSLKKAIALLVIGLLMLIAGSWFASTAHDVVRL